MRKTIFEQIKDRISFASEIQRLDKLINDPNGIRIEIPNTLFTMTDNDFDIKYYSLEDFFDAFMFKTWKARGTCISCEDMREALNLDEILDSDDPTFEETISYCEYVANLIKLHDRAELKEGVHFYNTSVTVAIITNLNSIMDWLNQEMVFFENEERVLITEKNAAVTAVAECVDEELAYQIVKYNHYTLKGDISKKKEILLKLGSELEPKRGQLNSKLGDNIFFMLNNLNIRHNNKSKKDKNYKEYVAKMKKNKLEEWYDELYQMMLLAMLELEQVERNQKINELKTHF
ncbi:MAG: hypothetical protein IJ696_04570 [Ruminococcus sp.]|nr:hypothetical protein [Ruminococcus sp.]